ncbi:MAG: hypothetical protein P1P77_04000 [Spirochaetaceae bacterium]|nr:hypothetical protein [Spirochaetaceae bacterium]
MDDNQLFHRIPVALLGQGALVADVSNGAQHFVLIDHLESQFQGFAADLNLRIQQIKNHITSALSQKKQAEALSEFLAFTLFLKEQRVDGITSDFYTEDADTSL